MRAFLLCGEIEKKPLPLPLRNAPHSLVLSILPYLSNKWGAVQSWTDDFIYLPLHDYIALRHLSGNTYKYIFIQGLL